MARLVEVSVRPAISGCMAMTPCGQGDEEIDERALAVLGQGEVLAGRRLERVGRAGLDGLVFDLDLVEGLLEGRRQRPDLDGRAGQQGHGLAGDGVVLAAALDADDLELGRRLGLAEHAGQELDGVAPALIDVEAGMAAAEAVNVELVEVLRSRLLPVEGQGQRRIRPAGAADGEGPLVLAVEVEEHLAGEEALLDLVGPGQTRFPRRP